MLQSCVLTASHDENMYSESFSFLPERFLDDGGYIVQQVVHPDKTIFRYGRR